MKKFTILTTIILTAVIESYGDTHSYLVTTNTSWSAKNYTVNDGKASVFTISSGVKLTIDQKDVSCYECSFSGGSIEITQDFTCQGCSFSNTTISMTSVTLSLQSSLSSFSNVHFTVSGTGELNATAALSISNSVFTFNNSAYLYNNGGELDLSGSTLYFNGNAYFQANAGPVNLKNGTEVFVGTGASTSKAYFKMNGGTLNIYDNSGIDLGNDNNYYFNWSSYNSGTTNSSISTYPNTLNCGGSFANSCQNPMVYGPESVSAAGLGTINILPVLLTGFNAGLSGHDVEISWMTQQETNSAYFELERSQDGIIWEALGTVAAKGNSATVSEYAYQDNAPMNGTDYYRLKMVNIDNSYNFSTIKTVTVTAVNRISFFPNPAQSYVNVSLKESAGEQSIQLLNISGQVLAERKVAAGNATTITLNVEQYARGMYVLRVMNADGASVSGKIVITH